MSARLLRKAPHKTVPYSQLHWRKPMLVTRPTTTTRHRCRHCKENSPVSRRARCSRPIAWQSPMIIDSRSHARAVTWMSTCFRRKATSTTKSRATTIPAQSRKLPIYLLAKPVSVGVYYQAGNLSRISSSLFRVACRLIPSARSPHSA